MKYLNKIIEVSQYFLIEKNIYIFNKEGYLFKWNYCTIEWKIKTESQYFLLDVDKSSIIVYSPFSKILQIDKVNGDVIKSLFEKKKPLRIFNNQILMVNLISDESHNNTFEVSYLDILNFKETKGVNTKFFFPILIDSNYCYSQSSKKDICAISLLNSEIIWQKEFLFVISKIEFWKQEIILFEILTSPNTILGIQTKDGNVLWQKTGIFLHIYDDFIYFISNPNHSTFIVKKIEPIKGIEQIFDLSIILEKNNLLLDVMKMEYVVKDNLIYFSFFYKKTLLIVNLKTLKQEWIHKIETNASWINEPRIVGNRLYVLDEANTLHIFEKEKVINLKASSE